MTPKEKAEELVEKFKNRSIELGESHSQFLAEENALIAVDEIIDAIVIINEYDFEPLNEYWQEVKQEIEKL
jgi:hypothetical protein